MPSFNVLFETSHLDISLSHLVISSLSCFQKVTRYFNSFISQFLICTFIFKTLLSYYWYAGRHIFNMHHLTTLDICKCLCIVWLLLLLLARVIPTCSKPTFGYSICQSAKQWDLLPMIRQCLLRLVRTLIRTRVEQTWTCNFPKVCVLYLSL
jgi:hypothetical protein